MSYKIKGGESKRLIVELHKAGLRNCEIARKLGIKRGLVDSHLYLLRKLR